MSCENLDALADRLRYYLRLECWTARDGLLILSGIDPEKTAKTWRAKGSRLTLQGVIDAQTGTLCGLCGHNLFPLLIKHRWEPECTLPGAGLAALADICRRWRATKHPPPAQGAAHGDGWEEQYYPAAYFLEWFQRQQLEPAWGAWAAARGLDAGALLALWPGAAIVAAQNAPPRAVQRLPAQEAALLRELHTAGYNPERLPRRTPGSQPWVLAEMRARLINKEPFRGPRTVEKAWDRLRAQGLIREE